MISRAFKLFSQTCLSYMVVSKVTIRQEEFPILLLVPTLDIAQQLKAVVDAVEFRPLCLAHAGM
jgi:hypothetical protein